MTGDIIKKEEMIFGSLSDFEMAVKVRMLMRDELQHEAVCCAARDRIMYLSQQLQATKDMLLTVTAVCNGSSAMEHLDAFRNADTMLQETEKERFRKTLEQIALGQFTAHGCKEIASKSLAESV